jgi:hypothetical protein
MKSVWERDDYAFSTLYLDFEYEWNEKQGSGIGSGNTH